MHRHASDLRVALSHALDKEDIGGLTLPISLPFRACICHPELVELDSTRGMHFLAERAQHDQPHITSNGHVSCAEHHRPQEAQHDGVTDVIGSELDLEALRGETGRDRHDTRVSDETVKAGGAEVV